MTFYAIIVIYNYKLDHSSSFNACLTFLKRQDFRILLFDNSTEPIGDPAIKGVTYIPMGGNKGIGGAYAAALDYVPKVSDSCVLLLDQDSIISDEYFFTIVETMVNHSEIMIVAPLVYDTGGLLSPGKMGLIKAKRFGAHGIKMNKGITFINSGLCIRASVFSTVAFDQGLFLDYIDHDFFRRYHQAFPIETIKVMDDKIIQSFSGTETSPISVKLARFKIYIKDYCRFNRKNATSMILCRIDLFLRAVKLSLQYNSFCFIQEFLATEESS